MVQGWAAVSVSYRERLVSQLHDIHTGYGAILAGSSIVNIDPNRPDSSFFIIGAAIWGWSPSDPAGERARMDLLGRLRDWGPRFRLLFPHPTPDVQRRLDEPLEVLERGLVRQYGDHSVPSTVAEATEQVAAAVSELASLADLLPEDEFPIRLAPDTNALIDNPDLAAYVAQLGARYRVHLLPTTLRELDDLKRAGRNPDLREAAQRANTRLKGLRHNGDVLAGIRVAGDVSVVFEHVEPRGEHLPSWLDLTVPDDRFVASVLLLQSGHPGSVLHVATGDINMQTKLAAAGLPYVEPPTP